MEECWYGVSNRGRKRTFALALNMPMLLESMRHHDLDCMISQLISDKFPGMYLYQWDWEYTMTFLGQYVSVYVTCENRRDKTIGEVMAKSERNYICDPFPALDNYVELTDAPDWTTMTDEEKQTAREIYDAQL